MQIFWMLHLKQMQTTKVLEPEHRKLAIIWIFQIQNSKNISWQDSKAKLTYTPNKPTKWGIRIYVRADAITGYVYCILPYYGSLTSEDLARTDLPASTRIVLQLSKTYQIAILTVNDTIFLQIGTTQAYYLPKLNIHLTGTI